MWWKKKSEWNKIINNSNTLREKLIVGNWERVLKFKKVKNKIRTVLKVCQVHLKNQNHLINSLNF